MELRLSFEIRPAVELLCGKCKRGNANSLSIVSITCLSVTNSRGKVLLNVVPNIFPATRIIAKKDFGDESLVDYIQVRDLNDNLGLKLTVHPSGLGSRIFSNLTFTILPTTP